MIGVCPLRGLLRQLLPIPRKTGFGSTHVHDGFPFFFFFFFFFVFLFLFFFPWGRSLLSFRFLLRALHLVFFIFLFLTHLFIPIFLYL